MGTSKIGDELINLRLEMTLEYRKELMASRQINAKKIFTQTNIAMVFLGIMLPLILSFDLNNGTMKVLLILSGILAVICVILGLLSVRTKYGVITSPYQMNIQKKWTDKKGFLTNYSEYNENLIKISQERKLIVGINTILLTGAFIEFFLAIIIHLYSITNGLPRIFLLSCSFITIGVILLLITIDFNDYKERRNSINRKNV